MTIIANSDESTPSYWDGTSIDQSWYTVGQAEYHIKTAAQRAALSNLTNQNSLPHNVVYHLDRDIDLNNYEWNAIGCVVNNYAYYFRGTFDGHGHTIKNLNITKTKTGYTSADGLFGVLADNAEVNNLNVEGTINLDYSSNPNMTSTYVGGVIGWGAGENSLVTNCHSNVNITVISSGAIVGGIVGVNGDPVGCSSKGAITVSGSNQQVNVGGIVGSLYQSSSARDIARCSSSCTITVSTSVTTFVGGIVGLSYGRHISDIIFSGNIISKAQGFCISGGLIGHPNTCTITNGIMIGSYQNNGNSTYMGAISGSTSDTNFYNCYYLNSLSSSTSYGTPVSVSTLTSGSPLSGFSTSIWAFPSGNYPYIKYD